MSGWIDSIGNTLREEFSDVPDAAGVTRIIIRLSFAAVLGGILGYEREANGKSAGMRTHMLVAMGSALFVLIPQQAGVTDTDLTRVLQGLVAGIGFLGAGTIIKRDNEEEVKGLTTAAGIWLTAAVGIAAGMGRELTAVISTLLALAILTIMPRLFSRFEKGTNESRKPPGK
jgi:putative Mg2+ transporter-C (MgtC) family protein